MKYTANYSIEVEIVKKFNKKVPAMKRSGIVETLISDYLESKKVCPIEHVKADTPNQPVKEVLK